MRNFAKAPAGHAALREALVPNLLSSELPPTGASDIECGGLVAAS